MSERLRLAAIVCACLVLVVGAAIGGYALGGGGASVEEARDDGAAVGRALGAEVGTIEAYAPAYEEARSREFEEAYEDAYRAAYGAEYDTLDLEVPEEIPLEQ